MSWTRGFQHILREHEPLAPYTWLRIGGPARYFAEPTTLDELAALVKCCHEENIPTRLLGGGSNLLISDSGVEGLVLHLTAAPFGMVTRQGNGLIAGGGARLAHLVSTAAREGLAGLEDLVGIPGTVGGAVHGNATGQHGDIGAWVRSATVVTRGGELAQRKREEMHFSYRSSTLDELIILETTLELEPADPVEVTKRMQKNWIVKRSSLPASSLAQGCMFRDSGGVSAASLIEDAGLAGLRVGDVEVSESNPNFVLVGRTATSAQVRDLIDTIRRTVTDRLGVRLEPSLEMW